MKKSVFITFLVVFIIGGFVSKGQIPNSGFQSWKTENGFLKPVGWETEDGINNAPNSITPVTPGYSGNNLDTAVMMTVVDYDGISWCSSLQTKFHCTTRPTALTGYIESNNSNSDTFQVSISFFKNNKLIGSGVYYTYQSILKFKEFKDNITFTDTAKPDTCIINFFYNMQMPDPETEFTIDILQFLTSAVNIEEIENQSFNIGNLSPNPANNFVNIPVFTSHTATMQIYIYDMLGRKIKTFENKEALAGKSNVCLDLSDITSGVYFVNIQSDNSNKITKKLIHNFEF